ncbi:hypothetical protein PLIIFM63780_000081 [Purpureocillium lilacinum]|uniref:F-box-like domain-containing protein n=1 Tax=Purpureocillium lilacinum TaxID=33203 RepID=A0A179HCD0_PURLI|nr:F-box-like domain-containing protein [Purpureocillium lilacinum]GJN76595.1 hypothetical protein PLIIFM63780_000081 [Purpureocillium lilacinum]
MAPSLETLPVAALLKITANLDSAQDVLALARVSKTMYERVTTRSQQILEPFITPKVFCLNLGVLLRTAYAATVFRDCLSQLADFEIPAPVTINNFSVLACAAHLADNTMRYVNVNGMRAVYFQALCPFNLIVTHVTASYSVWLNKAICMQRCALVRYAALIWLSKQEPLRGSEEHYAWRDFLLDFYPEDAVNNELCCEHWCSLVQDLYLPEGSEKLMKSFDWDPADFELVLPAHFFQ